jgi:hypothetical protein
MGGLGIEDKQTPVADIINKARITFGCDMYEPDGPVLKFEGAP